MSPSNSMNCRVPSSRGMARSSGLTPGRRDRALRAPVRGSPALRTRGTTGLLVRSDSLRLAPPVSGCRAMNAQLNC
jgi:hypothetical protein